MYIFWRPILENSPSGGQQRFYTGMLPPDDVLRHCHQHQGCRRTTGVGDIEIKNHHQEVDQPGHDLQPSKGPDRDDRRGLHPEVLRRCQCHQGCRKDNLGGRERVEEIEESDRGKRPAHVHDMGGVIDTNKQASSIKKPPSIA